MNRYAATVLSSLLLACMASPLAAQEPEVTPPPEVLADSLPPSEYPWLVSYFPYVAGGLGGGPVLAARLRYFQPAPYSERQTYRAEAVAEVGIGLHGSRFADLRYRAPLMSEELRLLARFGARRNTREAFFGLGNDTEYDPDAEAADEFHYRVHRTTYHAALEATRRITGPFKASVLGSVERERYYNLSTGSVFAGAVGSGLEETDYAARGALVLDLRDNEFDPTRGGVIDIGYQVGSGGDGYTRLYGVARAYRQLGARMMVTARLGASQLYGDPSIPARFEIPAWEFPLRVYGGGTNRSLRTSRFAGSGLIFGNLDVRREVLVRNVFSVTMIAFVDAGRVFEGEKLRLTTQDLQVGGGGGIAVRILRTTTVVGYLATGPDGVRVHIGGGWAY